MFTNASVVYRYTCMYCYVVSFIFIYYRITYTLYVLEAYFTLINGSLDIVLKYNVICLDGVYNRLYWIYMCVLQCSCIYYINTHISSLYPVYNNLFVLKACFKLTAV